MSDKKLIDAEILLEKFPGKGGWTYASLLGLKNNKNKAFGLKKVKGYIDDYYFSDYHLMPMGDGTLFLPVNKKIRDSIKKYAGDYVKVIIYEDNSEFIIPQYIIECLEMESTSILEKFKNLTLSKKREFTKYIESVKSEEARSKRILDMINYLENQK